MTCPICNGNARIRGVSCPACDLPADLSPQVRAARLALRAEGAAQMAECAPLERRAAFHREAALSYLAQVHTLHSAHLDASTRDAAAVRCVEAAIDAGMDVEPVVVALVRMVSARGLNLVCGVVRLRCTVDTEARLMGVLHG